MPNNIEWNSYTPEVLRTLVETYLFKPQHPRYDSLSHTCTLLGYSVTFKLINYDFVLIYHGFDHTFKPMFSDVKGRKLGGGMMANVTRRFDIRDPEFIDKIDDFFAEIGVPILYTSGPSNGKFTPTYDLKLVRERRDQYGFDYKPATKEEIRSINQPCNAIWMLSQINAYDCKTLDDFRGGLMARIMHSTMIEIWGEWDFDLVYHFMTAFLDKETRETFKKSYDHRDESRSHRSTYFASENGETHFYDGSKNPKYAARDHKALQSKHRQDRRERCADAPPENGE